MENWEQVGKAARIAADSQGNAAQKMDAYTDSVQAAKNRITAAVEKLTMQVNLEGLLKTFYKVTGGLIDNIGLISGALATYLFKFKGQSLFSGIFGDGKILNNSAYKLMDIGSGMNNQGSLHAAMKNYFGDQTIDGKTTNKFKEHVAEMAAMQAQMTTEKRFFGTGTTFNEQQQSTLRRGLSLQDGSDIFMNDAQVRNVMQSYISSAEEGNFLLDKENAVRSELINALATEEEKELIASGKISEEEYANITNRMTSSLEGREKELKAAMTRYITGLDENGVELTDEAANRTQYLAALQKGLTTEEKNQIVMNMLTDEQMEETREIAKKRVAETKMANATEEEIAELEEVAIAEERLKVALNQYAKAMEKATPEQRRIFAQHVNTKYDYETGMKSLRQGAVTTGFMTAGAVAPMVLSKGAGALGEKFGMDDSTSAIVSMLGMSGLGNIAGRNVKGISEGAAAFSKAAKSARLAANTMNGANGLIGAFNTMTSSAKAGITAMMGVEGAMMGLASAGLLVAGVIAMVAMQAHEKAKEARAEAYKESKAQYDQMIDATATFNDSKYTHLATGVDKYGNNINLTDEEYDEFVEMSNQLAQAFPELVTYTDELGNQFLSTGEDAKGLGKALEEATVAAQRQRDRDLLATREDMIGDFAARRTEITDSGAIYTQAISALKGEGYAINKDTKQYLEDTFGFTIKGKNQTVIKEDGTKASNAEIQKAINSAQASLDQNSSEIRNLSAEYSDYFIAQARQSMGYTEDGLSVYEQLPEATKQKIQQAANSGIIAPDAPDYANQVATFANFAAKFDWETYDRYVNNENASSEDISAWREQQESDIMAIVQKNGGWDASTKAIAESIDFTVNADGTLTDTINGFKQLKDIMAEKNFGENVLQKWGISEPSVKTAKQLAQWIQEGKINAETSQEVIKNMLAGQDTGEKGLKARVSAAKGVNEESMGSYMDKLIKSGKSADLESVYEHFGSVSGDLANNIMNEANAMLVEAASNLDDIESSEKKISKSTKQTASNTKKTSKNTKSISTNTKKTATSISKTVKATKSITTETKKQVKALKGKTSDGGSGGKNAEVKDAEDSAKKIKTVNKGKVKDFKVTGDKIVKQNKASMRKITADSNTAQLEDDLVHAQEAYQQFFSSIEDTNGNGYLDTWSELSAGFELINESITRTNNALDEQKQYGQLSMQTALQLLSADENYINVLDVKNGKIQLAGDAEKQMAQIQMEAMREQIQTQIAEIESEEEKIEAILAAGEATSSELTQIGLKVEGQNEEINATNASVSAAYASANAQLVAAAGYDTAGNAASQAAKKIVEYNKALDGAKSVKSGGTNDKTTTVWAGTYGSAPTTKDANFKVEKPEKLTAKQRKKLNKKLNKLKDRKKLLKDFDKNLDSVDSFTNAYEPGGGKSGGSGGGGGGSGDKYTRLDKVKDILDAINKEYLQMLAYEKKVGTGHNIDNSYYAQRRKYLNEEIELLKKKAKKDGKKSDLSDYYSDLKDLQQAKIDLANLDDEKIQDRIDLLEARKEITGIAYKYEIGLYKQLLKTADTEQERLEYEKKLIDAQREEIQNQKEIAEAMKETLSLENAMMLAYRGLTQTYKKTSTGYTLVSDLQGLSGVTIKGTDGHTATGFDNATNRKRVAAVEKAKKKHKYVKVGKDDTGTLQYAYSDKNAANAEKALAEKIQKANIRYGSDTIDADWAYITDSFGTQHWYIKSKANSTTAKNIKNYKKKGYYVAISVDDSGKLHFAKHKKTKKYTKKKAKEKLKKKVDQYKERANYNIQHQDDGGSTQEHNSKVKKDPYLKAVEADVKTMRTAEAESGATIAAIEANGKDRINNLMDEASKIAKERQTYTEGSADWIKLGGEYDEKIHDILEVEKEMVQTKIDLLEAAGINNQLLIAEYENLVKTSSTLQEEWENQKKLNDARKDYNSLLRDTLEYKYALYDNILEYESYTPSKDANSQYMKAISAQKDILEEELKMAKENAEEYRKWAFDANVRANLEYGMSEQEAKDQAWEDSANDSDYQEAVNQYVEAFQKMGELVIRQFNDIADAIGRKLDKMEQARAENWVTTWKNAYSLVYQDKDVKIKVTEDGSIKDYEAIMDKWDSYDAEKMVPATTKIKDYYNAVIQMQEQIKAEAIATLSDVTNKVTYLTDEQVQELVDKYNEAAVEIHQAMIDQMQDTVDYQDTLYNAVVDEVNDIIFNLEKQKELTEKMYDDEIESLQKKEDSIQRTNDLLAKQKALQDALNDRQRVYRSGKIMPMTNYIG